MSSNCTYSLQSSGIAPTDSTCIANWVIPQANKSFILSKYQKRLLGLKELEIQSRDREIRFLNNKQRVTQQALDTALQVTIPALQTSDSLNHINYLDYKFGYKAQKTGKIVSTVVLIATTIGSFFLGFYLAK